LLLGACGTPTTTDTEPSNTQGPDASAPFDAAAPPPPSVPLTSLGVWQIEGKDQRGAYRGRGELRKQGSALFFARAIAYDTLTVEDGRALHLAWTGKVATLTADAATLEGTLEPRDFIAQRGASVRSLSDAPIATRAVLTRGATFIDVTWNVERAVERWFTRTESGAEPIFQVQREVRGSHAPPSSSERAVSDATFGSYRALPEVAPYVSRPEFSAAIFGRVYDRTDFAFYRENPRALRVVNKPVDEISLQETRLRADAFGPTLESKAKAFDQEMDTDFMDPGVWFSPDSRTASGIEASGDGALWTATYLASQIYRFEVSGEAQAKVNAKRTLDAMLKLQEITGNWGEFARTLRKSNGVATLPWHAGTGTFAGLDWLQGGNNDMLKGLFLAYTLGYPFFCEGARGPLWPHSRQRIASGRRYGRQRIGNEWQQTHQPVDRCYGEWERERAPEGGTNLGARTSRAAGLRGRI
jgi:hypothetical protein